MYISQIHHHEYFCYVKPYLVYVPDYFALVFKFVLCERYQIE